MSYLLSSAPWANSISLARSFRLHSSALGGDPRYFLAQKGIFRKKHLSDKTLLSPITRTYRSTINHTASLSIFRTFVDPDLYSDYVFGGSISTQVNL